MPALQDDGLIFLWVTGRAMELGRECLKLWGYVYNTQFESITSMQCVLHFSDMKELMN